MHEGHSPKIAGFGEKDSCPGESRLVLSGLLMPRILTLRTDRSNEKGQLIPLRFGRNLRQRAHEDDPVALMCTCHAKVPGHKDL